MSVRTRTRAALLVALGLVATLAIALAPGRGDAVGKVTTPIRTPNDGPVATAAMGKGTPYCGRPMRKPDGTPWTCTFSDYFDGTKLNSSKWRLITSRESSFGDDRNDCYVNSRYNVAVNSGVLKMVTRRNLVPFKCGVGRHEYTTTATSPLVSTFSKFEQNRGRFQFRAKFPLTSQKGIQAALWLYPDSGGLGPVTSGEIDIAEWYSVYPRRVIPYLHYTTGVLGGVLGSKEVTNVNCIVKRVDQWHTYTLEWTSDKLVISYDGVPCLTNTSGVILGQFSRQYFLNMMMAQGVHQNPPTALTPLRSMAQIDWVRVWK